jgi:hypothetical protein
MSLGLGQQMFTSASVQEPAIESENKLPEIDYLAMHARCFALDCSVTDYGLASGYKTWESMPSRPGGRGRKRQSILIF